MTAAATPAAVRVLYHAGCFDGCASAAMFSAFYRTCVAEGATFEYQRLVHGPGGPLADSIFGPGENAIVDFRYSTSDRLTWWIDHHRSAFPSEEAREHFRTRPPDRFIFDPAAPSCTGLIARVLGTSHQFDPSPHAELLYWAELIDAAAFPDAQTAVELPHPALQLMMVLEGAGDGELERLVIERMQRDSLAEIVASPEVQQLLAPLDSLHRQSIEDIRERARIVGRTVTFDLSDRPVEGYNKFIPYHLHPSALYTVGLTSGKDRVKISVGSNPWRRDERRHDIAALCERYGGGGHPAVGAISLPPGSEERGRAIVRELVEALGQ